MILTKNSNICIILPQSPTARERFAAEELKKYLFAMLGADAQLSQTRSQEAQPTFLIGGPERNTQVAALLSEQEFAAKVPGPEGLLIQSLDENTVLLAGSSWHVGECERGTIYAVYEFLERFCGCVLAAYAHPDANAGEIVPTYKHLCLEGLYAVKPYADLPYRTAIVQYEDVAGNPDRGLNLAFFDWLVKNRYNRILTWSSVYTFFKKSGLLDELECRGLRFTVGHHESSRLFLPALGNEEFPEHYFETHPEYFKLQEDGTRFFNKDPWGQWVYCSRNEQAAATVAENVIAWLYRNPSVDIVALWPNDGIFPQCTCPDCAPYTKTENYCHFINKVAEIVTRVHPNVKFDMLIYVDLWECPEGLKLHPSILVDEATWHSSGLRTVGRPDGKCLSGTHFEENLLKWKQTGAQVVYYDYYMGIYSNRQRWLPMADGVQAIWKNFMQKGISGAGTQIECFNLWNHLLNFYTFGRTGYDTSLSVQDTAHALAALCGEGGAEVAEIWLAGERCIDGQLPIHKCCHFLMEQLDKADIYARFERAFEAAKEPRHRNNLRLLRMAFRYSDLESADPCSHAKYQRVMEGYADATGELARMCEFDSFTHCDPGFGISIPLTSKTPPICGDKWYEFE